MMAGLRGTQYRVTSALALATLTNGATSGWLTPMMSKIWQHETPLELTDSDSNRIRNLSTLGFMLGSLLTVLICNRLGRCTTMLVSAGFSLFGMILVIFAKMAWMLYVVQILWGISSGIVYVTVPIYLAEIADKDIRGTLCVSTRVTTYIGSLFVVGVGNEVSYNAFNYWFPIMPILYFVACYPIPESPYYLLRRNNKGRAKEELLKLREDTSSEDQLENMKSHVDKEMQNSCSFFELFRRKRYRRSIVIVFGLKLIQAMSGYGAIYSYGYSIMEESDISMHLTHLFLIYLAVHVVGGILAAILVDIKGRRFLLIRSFIGAFLAIGIVATYFTLRDIISVDIQFLRKFGFVVITGAAVFAFMGSLGLDSIIVVLLGELFPINVRVEVIFAINVFAGISFPVSHMFRIIYKAVGIAGVLWVYALVALAGAVFTYFVIPETKRKSLREIQDMLQGNNTGESGEEMTNTRI